MKVVSEKLKLKNLKVTPQRLAIYNMLSNNFTHPNAETIYKTLEEEYPTMSLATVYKTLDAFKNVGLVRELNVGEDSFRYDANTESHPHFICKGCNKVLDIFDVEGLSHKDLGTIKHNVEQKLNFEIDKEQIYFFGLCGDCKVKEV